MALLLINGGCLSSSPRGGADDGDGGAGDSQGAGPAEGAGEEGAAGGEEGGDPGPEVAEGEGEGGGDDEVPPALSWPILVEAEDFETNEFWAVCPSRRCEDDRSDRAHGRGHLVTFEDRTSQRSEAALHHVVALPSGGEVSLWALTVRAGRTRRWAVTAGDGDRHLVGGDDAGRWERAGTWQIEGNGSETEVAIFDASPDTFWAYPDALLFTEDPEYDPNDEPEGGEEGGEGGGEEGGEGEGGEGGGEPDPVNRCEEQGGVCINRSNSCEDGQVREGGMGCPGGRRARCCLRDTQCDDDSEVACDEGQPECGGGELAAIQGGCWECINARTCLPWGEPGCASDADCPPAEYCDPWGTSACLECAEAIAACSDHDCDTGAAVNCLEGRPDCGEGAVSVIRAGCWVCVDRDSCERVPEE